MRQLVRNARIVTGDGHTPPLLGDVLIEDDVVAAPGAVGLSQARTADRVIDAKGRALAPGFVDTHYHGALGGTALGASRLPLAYELAILGGVTKRICGVDGLSPAPVTEAQRSQCAAQLTPLDGAIAEDWTWSSVAKFLARHRGRSVADMGIYLGHSAVRRVVMSNVARVATDAEIQAMSEVVRHEAPLTLGLSTGMEYLPAVDGGGAYCNEHSKIAGAQNYDRVGEFESLLADAASLIPTMENRSSPPWRTCIPTPPARAPATRSFRRRCARAGAANS